jgi:hypothetical protein
MILKACNVKAIAKPPANIPHGYKGPIALPTGREVYWTGRVAIGLNYVPVRHNEMSSNEEWLQKVLLKK